MEEHSQSSSSEHTYIGGPLDGNEVPEELREDAFGLVRMFRGTIDCSPSVHLYVHLWNYWGYAGTRKADECHQPTDEEVSQAFRVLGVG